MNKLLVLIALLATATSPLSAQSPTAPEEAQPLTSGHEPVKDIFPRWSVCGEWRVTHPDWTDIVTLRADGSLVTKHQGTTGKWILTADAGTPMLVFCWDRFGTESVKMVTLDHFRGNNWSGKLIDMQRGNSPSEPESEPK